MTTVPLLEGIMCACLSLYLTELWGKCSSLETYFCNGRKLDKRCEKICCLPSLACFLYFSEVIAGDDDEEEH